ncbi:MAG: DUF3592 domain-containing protein [Candidatus Desulfofervidus auxilii]|nr:DUF3592 domain-containing protein [Candidatus Desulfofervidus auxilii]
MSNNQFSFFKVYQNRYSPNQLFTLFILLVIASLLVFVAGEKVYKGIKEYNRLQKEGIFTTAYVSDVAFGGGRMGSNFVYYYFYDANNKLIEKKEQVGRKIQGKPLANIKKGDRLQIIFLKENPSISQIVGNTAPLITYVVFFIFFAIMWVVIFAIIFLQIAKTIRVVNLYNHGIATQGIVLSKKVKATSKGTYGVDISYQFADTQGKVYVAKEEIRRVNSVKDLEKGDVVTVFYKKDDPSKSAIFLKERR